MSSPNGPPAAAPRRGAPWIAIAAAALLLGGGGVLAFQRSRAEPAPAERAPPARPSGVVYLDAFIVNLADPSGDRFFRLGVRIVLDSKEAAELASAGLHQARLRDRILSLLAKQRAAELASAGGRERLRERVLAEVAPLFAEPPYAVAEPGGGGPAGDAAPVRVLDVLFTEFLVQ